MELHRYSNTTEFSDLNEWSVSHMKTEKRLFHETEQFQLINTGTTGTAFPPRADGADAEADILQREW